MIDNNNSKFLAQKISAEYTPKQTGPLEELKKLDAKVKRPPIVFACIWGTISVLIMGAGMSLTMTEIGQLLSIPSPMVTGIGLGLVGIFMAALTWPICKGMLSRRRRKFGPKIMALSQSILEQE